MYNVSRAKAFIMSLCGFLLGALMGDDNIPLLILMAIVYSMMIITAVDAL